MADRVRLADCSTWPFAGAGAAHCAVAAAGDCWRVTAEPGAPWSGVVLRPPSGGWPITACAELQATVRNPADQPITILLRGEDGHASSERPSNAHCGARVESTIPAGETVTMRLPLTDGQSIEAYRRLLAIRSLPHPSGRRGTLDAGALAGVFISVSAPQSAVAFEVVAVTATGAAPTGGVSWDDFRPWVDTYGQYAHADWPAKIHSDADFRVRLKAEEPDLAAHERPADWNPYGGWATGPQLDATGYFRVEKLDGRWWMVDPEGRLFWSHGAVRVGTRIRVGGIYHGSPIDDREADFDLPPRDSELGQFYGDEPQASRGYYLGKHPHRVYDHLEANLYRKWGPDWATAYAAHTQRRLASWGLNTIANSSDPGVFLRRQTPYTAVVYSAPLGRTDHRIEGSSGNWGKLPDPFDPGWRAIIEETLRTEVAESVNDPWCLGFFVDNELHWGDQYHLAEATLASPAHQPAKVAFLRWLTDRHGDLAGLNRAWGTDYADGQAFLIATALPDRERGEVKADLEAFSQSILDAYFRTCHDCLAAAAPNHLYLGCRFAGAGNERVMRTASQYCDIVSINRYARDIASLKLPTGCDRPIIIGEFHIGAANAEVFSPPALVNVMDVPDKIAAIRAYVDSGLANPAVVGTHWFQYYDQPAGGRFDGENYPCGLVDLGDTPKPEMVALCREIGAGFYRQRMGE